MFVLTDISDEPDDEESLVRFLVYANEFDVEEIVATTTCDSHFAVRTSFVESLIPRPGRG